MSDPETSEPAAGTPSTGEHDPEVAEEYAESLPIDPAPDQIDNYLRLVGDPEVDPAQDGDPASLGAADHPERRPG